MQTKSLTIESMDEAGIGLARIAQLSQIDSDGDTYEPGAFSWKEGGEQWAPILVAHNRMMIPVGKARVYEEGDWAFSELHVNLEIQAARDWHAALRFDLAKGKPVQEWSYGFETLDAIFRGHGQSRVRVIKRQDVHEVSTVVRGAGVGTATLAIKSAELKADRFAALIGGLGELADALPDDVTAISATGVKQLEAIEAAIGKSLNSLRAPGDENDGVVDTALAQYLIQQSRRHLPSPV